MISSEDHAAACSMRFNEKSRLYLPTQRMICMLSTIQRREEAIGTLYSSQTGSRPMAPFMMPDQGLTCSLHALMIPSGD